MDSGGPFVRIADLARRRVFGSHRPVRIALSRRRSVPRGGGSEWRRTGRLTLAVAHAEGTGSDARIVVDVMKGRSRRGVTSVDLTGMVREIAGILKRYRIQGVVGDRYAWQWVSQAFADTGVSYTAAPADASTALSELEPFFAEGRIDLLDHPQLTKELKALERRLRAGGKTLIEHPRGGHDDHAVALALATLQCRPDMKPRLSVSRILAAGRRSEAAPVEYYGRHGGPGF